MIATVMMLGVPCHRVLGNRQPLRSQIGSLHPCRHRSSRRHAFQSLPQTARRSTAAAAAPKPASIEDLAARDQLLDTLLDSKSQEEVCNESHWLLVLVKAPHARWQCSRKCVTACSCRHAARQGGRGQCADIRPELLDATRPAARPSDHRRAEDTVRTFTAAV